jgi:hypothetical protein
MTDPDLEIPIWVQRLRDDGFKVRMGTGTEGLSEEPEVMFTLPRDSRMGLRRRVVALARRIWGGAGRGERLTNPTGHASLP